MATENGGINISLVAAADLSAKQFYCVKVDSDGKAALAGAGDCCIGILQDDPASGEVGSVRTRGASKAVAGGNVAAGDLVAANASGKVVTATKGKTDTSDAGGAADPLIGSNVLGVALSAGADGEVIEVAILHLGAVPTTNA